MRVYIQVRWHTLIISLLTMMDGREWSSRETSEGHTDFWILKALLQLISLRIYHAKDGRAAKAVKALLPGGALSIIPRLTDFLHGLRDLCRTAQTNQEGYCT